MFVSLSQLFIPAQNLHLVVTYYLWSSFITNNICVIGLTLKPQSLFHFLLSNTSHHTVSLTFWSLLWNIPQNHYSRRTTYNTCQHKERYMWGGGWGGVVESVEECIQWDCYQHGPFSGYQSVLEAACPSGCGQGFAEPPGIASSPC